MSKAQTESPLRERIHEIIFEADTPAGKTFDVSLLVLILISIGIVMLESVQSIGEAYSQWFGIAEWIITIFFTIEYALRIYCVRNSWKYILSFYGIVDLLSIIPTYLSVFFLNSHYFLTIRTLRLLRVFRIFKLAQYSSQSRVLWAALKASRPKITVFLSVVFIIVILIGSIMYWVEGDANSGFTSIPRSMYWAIVTLTTVGYGDIAPSTTLGQFLAAIIMVLGYGILAVPTGIVSAELVNVDSKKDDNTISCNECSEEGHDSDAVYCKYCGAEL